jgi:hypothetical protein
MLIKDLPENKDLRIDTSKACIWTIPDINGNLEKLKTAVKTIEESKILSRNDYIVFLGNIIGDEGSSKDCLAYLFEYWTKRNTMCIFLRGETEQMFLEASPEYRKTDEYKAIINSYRDKTAVKGAYYHNAVDVTSLSKDMVRMSKWPVSFTTSHFIFVHQSIDPKRKLDAQDPNTFALYNKDFDTYESSYGRMVIFGTAKGEPIITKNRIGVPNSSIILFNDTINEKKAIESHFKFGT